MNINNNKTVKLKLGCRISAINQPLISFLKENFNIIMCNNNPDYIIHTADTSEKYVDPKKVNILYTIESRSIDFNLFDYGIGYDYMNFQDRYLRYPYYLLNKKKYDKILKKPKNGKRILNEKKGFCSMLVSNFSHDPIMFTFFKKLSKYKKIDSGGLCLNNTGGERVKSKKDFIKKYKFNIAFENTKEPGYTTEKLVEALAENTIPIYWGDPKIASEFNTKSFILLESEKDIDNVIKDIIKLDKDDDAYIKMIEQPRLIPKTHKHQNKDQLFKFFENIFKQGPINAKRISKYRNSYYKDPGLFYRDEGSIAQSFHKLIKKALKFKIKIKQLINLILKIKK